MGPVNLKHFSLCPLSEAKHNPPPAGGHNPRGAAPSTLTPKVCPGKVCPLFIQYFQQGPCFFYGELAGGAGFFSGGEGEGGAQVVPGDSGEDA